MYLHTQLLALLASTLLCLPSTTAQAIEPPHGIDSGNTVCLGSCVQDPALLDCGFVKFRPQYGCYMCCITDDGLDEKIEADWVVADEEKEKKA
ncbi:hypothetical protein BJX61DRAFT_546694 [Aspergillus egyptiacus]|nr:hypothetical protein BJX61DRAFT_546694 [Aspergillus egyptiacus]